MAYKEGLAVPAGRVASSALLPISLTLLLPYHHEADRQVHCFI